LILIIILGEEYILRRPSLSSFFHPLITSSLFGPNILLNTIFSHTFGLFSYLNVRDKVSQPHRTRNETSVLYILIFTLQDSRREEMVLD
jgi:hypothetical protein